MLASILICSNSNTSKKLRQGDETNSGKAENRQKSALFNHKERAQQQH